MKPKLRPQDKLSEGKGAGGMKEVFNSDGNFFSDGNCVSDKCGEAARARSQRPCVKSVEF